MPLGVAELMPHVPTDGQWWRGGVSGAVEGISGGEGGAGGSSAEGGDATPSKDRGAASPDNETPKRKKLNRAR